MPATRHVNLTDDESQVYCHLEHDIVNFDGPFFAKTCWSCPFLCGLAGGYGIECCYVDENVGKGLTDITFRNAQDAEEHAPGKKKPESIASPDGRRCRDMRVKLSPPQKKTAEGIEAERAEKQATAAEPEAPAEENPPEPESEVGEEATPPEEEQTPEEEEKSRVVAAIAKAMYL